MGKKSKKEKKEKKSKKCVFAPAPFGPCRPRTPPGAPSSHASSADARVSNTSLTVTPLPPPAGRTRRSVPVAMTRVPQVRPLQNQIPRTARMFAAAAPRRWCALASSRLATAPPSTIVSNLDAPRSTLPSPHLPSRTQAKKLAARLKQGEVAGYTDAENPFGDANLTERFVWHKKIEKSLVNGVDPKELGLKAEKRRHEERLKEIEKVKMQREQRTRAHGEGRGARDHAEGGGAHRGGRAGEEGGGVPSPAGQGEERDHTVREGRARAIDLVSRNIHAEDGDEFDESVHPLEIFDGLTLSEMDELLNDVKTYLDLDHEDARHKAFSGPT